MKKVILLAIFILVVAGIAGAGYFYYRMNFANIYVDIKSNQTYRYYVEKKINTQEYRFEVTDVNISERPWFISQPDENVLKEQIKQRFLEGKYKAVKPQRYFLDCRAIVLPVEVGSKYISKARISTEKCYVLEEVQGNERHEDYSNKEYTIEKGEGRLLTTIVTLPYCLDFCDGRRVRKGETIEGKALVEYISQLLPGIEAKVQYIVSEIGWNTVTFKIDGSVGPSQINIKGDNVLIQGKISGYAVYDREKRLFTSLVISIPTSLSTKLSQEFYVFPVLARVDSDFKFNQTIDLRLEVDR